MTISCQHEQLLACFKGRDYVDEDELSGIINGYNDNTARINEDRVELLDNHEPMKRLAPPSNAKQSLYVSFSDEEDAKEDDGMEEGNAVGREVDMSLFVLFSDEDSDDNDTT